MIRKETISYKRAPRITGNSNRWLEKWATENAELPAFASGCCHLPPLAAAFGDVDGLWASERHDIDLPRVGKAAQIIGGHLPVQMPRSARQADGAQRLAAKLRQAGEDMLDASARFGNTAVTPSLSEICVRGRSSQLVNL